MESRITNHESRVGKPVHPVSYERGQAVITTVVFFLIIATTVGVGVTNPVLRQVRSADDFAQTRGSLFVSQAVNEDALYRLKTGKRFTSPSTLSLNGYIATATSTTVVGGLQLDSSASAFGLVRNIQTHLSTGIGASFHYGTQSDKGGLDLDDHSVISGNVYSNGPITGHNYTITGDVVSAGPSGSVKDVHATGSMYGHTIDSSTVDGDAYYVTISGTTVSGALHPGSADQATSSLPISDVMVTTWENGAAAGGVINSPCPYKITDSAVLGPVKINCDLKIEAKDNDVVTLGGPVWVVGKIDIDSKGTIKVDPSLGNQSVAVIADKPGDLVSGSKITINKQTAFQGNGSAGSFVLMLSQNKAAEIGESDKAISVGDHVSGDVILYAGHGKVVVSNHADVKELTGYRVELNNWADVVYQSGLVNLIFSSGPGGGYVFDKWREVQ